jgi:iron complex outermembrane recepter protein
MKKRFVLLAVLICRHLMMFSQYSVSGIVKDENGNALTGANVVIEHTYTGAITNLKGEFMLKGIQQGDHNLVISFLGFETVSKPVTVNNNVSLDIQLSRKAFLADEVIVQATRAESGTPVASSVVSQEDIHDQNAGEDIPFMLSLTPSAITTSDAGAGVGYTSLRIRGTDMTGINVTINGIPINDAESHQMYWVDLPDIAASADNIQIQRGVGTSTFGSAAFGATVNIQTLELNKNPYAEVDNAYGSFNTLRNSVSFGSGLINNHFTFDGRLSKITSDGYIDRAWSNLKSFYLSGSYYSGNSLFKINVFSGIEHTYQAWDGVPKDSLKTHRTLNGLGMYTDDFGRVQYYPNQTDNYQQDYAQMLFSHSFSSSLNINAALHYTKGKGYYEEYKESQNLLDYSMDTIFLPYHDTITNTNLIRQKWLDNVFYGFTGSVNYTKRGFKVTLGGGWNQYYGKHYGTVIWAKHMDINQINHQYYNSNGTKNDFNIFAKTSYQLSDYLSLFADVQFRRITHAIAGTDDGDNINITQSHEYKFFNPKAGLTFTPNEHHSFSGFFGVGHREPTRDDFVDADVSNPVVRPERLNDLEIGYNFKSSFLKLGVNYYYMSYKDQLILTGKINDVGSAIMTNVDKSNRSGLEFTGGLQILKNLTWAMNATFSRNIIKKFAEYIDNYDTWPQQTVNNLGDTKIAFSPEVVAGSCLGYNITKSISIKLLSKYVGKQYIDNTQSEDRRLNSYFVNDLRINCKFKSRYVRSIEPFVMINNLFDVKYETNAWVYQYLENSQHYVLDGYFPQAGTNLMIGLSLKF